jgi:hypothetical protein
MEDYEEHEDLKEISKEFAKKQRKKNGYAVEGKEEEFIHRKRAYHIYLENRDKYPLPYSAYEVHHIDFDKTNNKVSNLQILTPTEHDKLHEEHEKQLEAEYKKKGWINCKKCSKIIKPEEEKVHSGNLCGMCWINEHL